jgi:Protein of unknwon function (DUF3310)
MPSTARMNGVKFGKKGKIMSNVDHPAHYTAHSPEVIEIIERYELGYHIGNVLKYLLRAPFKGKEREDLKKAQWYLARYISLKYGSQEASESNLQALSDRLDLPEQHPPVQQEDKKALLEDLLAKERGANNGSRGVSDSGGVYGLPGVYGLLDKLAFIACEEIEDEEWKF